MLRRVVDALDGPTPSTAVSALLDVWKKTHDPAVADLLDEVSARIAEQNPVEEWKKQRDTTAAWVRDARDASPEALGPLLTQLEDVIDGRGKVYLSFPCYDLLASREDDPRVARLAARTLERGAVRGSAAGKVWTRCARMLLASPDAGALAICEALVGRRAGDKTLTTFRAERLPKFLEKLRKEVDEREDAAPVDEIETVRSKIRKLPVDRYELVSEPKPDGLTEADFIDKIVESPDDDDVRLVFADWLIDQGDERGDLITLQFRERDGAKVRTKVDRVAKKVRKKWLGQLTTHVVQSSVEFDRGIPISVTVDIRRAMHARVLLEAPEWATFQEIRFVSEWLVLSRHMRSLRRLHGVPLDRLGDLAEHPRAASLEALSLRFWPYRFEDNDRLPLVEHGPAFVGLKELGVANASSEQLTWLWSTPLVKNLSKVRTSSPPHWTHLDGWLALARKRPGLRIAFGPTTELWAEDGIIHADVVGPLDLYRANWLDGLRERAKKDSRIRFVGKIHDEAEKRAEKRLMDRTVDGDVVTGWWRE